MPLITCCSVHPVATLHDLWLHVCTTSYHTLWHRTSHKMPIASTSAWYSRVHPSKSQPQAPAKLSRCSLTPSLFVFHANHLTTTFRVWLQGNKESSWRFRNFLIFVFYFLSFIRTHCRHCIFLLLLFKLTLKYGPTQLALHHFSPPIHMVGLTQHSPKQRVCVCVKLRTLGR